MRLVLREVMRTVSRAPVLSALSVTTIAFALFVLGLFGLVAINLRAALDDVEERVEIVTYLRRGTPIDVVTVARSDIEAFPEVQSVTYVSEEDALVRARAELSEFQGLFDDLTVNPLPASLEVKLSPGFRDSESVSRVAERLSGFWFASDIRYGQDWLAKLDRLRSVAAVVVLVIGGAFGVASVIIIGTTVRMAVLHRSKEIAIMRLVGATDSFIRRPFLLDGALKGALGGLGALALNLAAFAAINALILRTAFFQPMQALGLVVFGAVFGLAASALSVGRHLRHVASG